MFYHKNDPSLTYSCYPTTHKSSLIEKIICITVIIFTIYKVCKYISDFI